MLLWCGTGFICLFAAKVKAERGDFLRMAGWISLFLGLDDLLLFHEGIWRDLWGLPEWGYVGLLLAVVGCYLARGMPGILSTPYPLLLVAMLCLGGSLMVDLTHYQPTSSRLDPEDQLKLLGIAARFSYHVQVAHLGLHRLAGSNSRGPTRHEERAIRP